MTTQATMSDARATFLADVVIAAVEGGCGYWGRVKAYSWGSEKGAGTFGRREYARAMFRDDEMLPEWTWVDEAVVKRGIERLKAPAFQVNAALRGLILAADAEDDASNIDAEAADVIIQAGLFGQIIYG